MLEAMGAIYDNKEKVKRERSYPTVQTLPTHRLKSITIMS